MLCIDCNTPLPYQKHHGNTKRCPECAREYKRESNKKRQFIIRLIGNPGLRNYQIINTLFTMGMPPVITLKAITQKGFSIQTGFIIKEIDYQTCTVTIQIMEFIIKLTPHNPEQKIKISKLHGEFNY
jgi:septin family protein